MTEPLQFQLQTTTGMVTITCAKIIVYRCPLCVATFTKEVMREHLETFHVLAIE